MERHSEAYLAGRRFAQQYLAGGNIYDGWTMPSQQMRDRIASWEGDSMTKETVDPLSGRKVKKNNSFESEARGFVAALPESIRERVLGNPQLADGLYSYSYNVGAGNFKKRVVPTLLAYYNGGATSDDVAAAMWASGDSKLRGLQKRRAVERGMVKDALWDTDMGRLSYAIDNPQPSFTPYNPEVFSKVISGEYEPTMEEQGLQGNQGVQENIGEIWKVGSTQERKSKAQSGIDRMMALQDMMRQYDEAGSGAALPAMDVNAPFVARIAGQGGGIHIKPSHRGRLTDLKARTGKTEAELYNDGNPAHKRMVVFARNARKWHGDGGMLNLFFDGGDQENNPTFVRENGNPVAFDAEGNLTDQVTGEEGRLTTPEVIVTPNGKPIGYRYSTAFDGSLDNFMEVTNVLTGGMANRLSPTQNVRLLYDVATGGDWRSSWLGNNGIVTDKFAEEHPYLSMAANMAGDMAVPLGWLGRKPVIRRGVETAMRTTASANPLPDIEDGLKYMWKNDKKRLGNIALYIGTGLKRGEKGYYNSFRKKPEQYYRGFINELDSSLPTDDDVIDAALYDKNISPNFGYDLSAKSSNVFDDYIKSNYPEKAADIKYYTLGEDVARSNTYKDNSIIKENWKSAESPMENNIWTTSDYMYPDVGGHQVQYGRDSRTGELVRRGADIWKFNPDDYMKRWGKEMFNNNGKPLTQKQKIEKMIAKPVLKVVDKYTTPVVFQTPWLKSSIFD